MFKLNESSAIKLFGKTIPLLTLNKEEEALTDHKLSFGGANREHSCDRNLLSSSNSLGGVNCNDEFQAQAPREDQESIEKELPKDKHEDSESHQIKEYFKDPGTLSGITDNGRSPCPLAERKTSFLKSSRNKETSETTSSKEKSALKKPDMILPCPRCNSKETKFCYYNNYNVNQPRHYCKNCQRYWTVGGTMRNVPVGAGRRKTRSSSSFRFQQVLISEAFRAAQANAARTNGIPQNPSYENNNSRVLTFGSGSSNQAEDKNYQWLPSKKKPCFTRPSWPNPWDSIQRSTPILPPPPIPGFPVSFHPALAHHNYSVPSPSDVPLAAPSPSVTQCTPSSSPISPSLGKHSREENILSPANLEKEKLPGESNGSERRASNSKTLRIDDPGETVKSSMLATLLIKSKKTNSINSGGLFDGFQVKSSDDRNYRLETFSVLRANPAALSRALNFQENTWKERLH